MADDDTPAKPPQAPSRIEAPMIFVKGGTTTASHDKLMAQQRADTEQRRAVQDRQYQATREDPLGARMQSMKLGGDDYGKIVLALKHPKDNLFLDWIVCELIENDPKDLVLNMACPHCRARNPGHEPDLKIHQSNRKWYFDTRPPRWMRDMGADRIWVNPVDRSTVIVAGTVTMDEWAHCPGLGCTWTFKIDDSVVHSR